MTTKTRMFFFASCIKEGEAFLETTGKVNENAKTRGQQKEIEENANDNGEETSPSKLARTTTMAATAKVNFTCQTRLHLYFYEQSRYQQAYLPLVLFLGG